MFLHASPKFYMHQMKHHVFCEELVNCQVEDMSVSMRTGLPISKHQLTIKQKANTDIFTLKWFQTFKITFD